MLDTLLESRARVGRPIAGTLVSIGAHTALIAAAVYATAQARTSPVSPRHSPPIYYVRPADPIPSSADRKATNETRPRSRERLIVRLLNVPAIDIKVPALQLSPRTTRPDDFGSNHIRGDQATGFGTGNVYGPDAAFRAEDVERQVELRPGSAPPVYPVALRNAGIEGKVVAIFVVDQMGRAEDSTVKFVSSDNRLFEDAVRTALERMRFVPAEAGGRTVRQLVQMPFVFTLRE
jgi:periplasmic protein TonB